jgi:chromosome segregation ATPase
MESSIQRSFDGVVDYIEELEDNTEQLKDEIASLRDDYNDLENNYMGALKEIVKLQKEHQKLLDSISTFLGTNLSKDDFSI